jgi:hypothetical protein
MALLSFLAVGLVIASHAVAAPVETQSNVVSLADAGRVGSITRNFADDHAQCNAQSCEIASLAGSTGRLPAFKPEGGDKNGYKCIARWNPEGVAAAAKLKAGPAQHTGISGALTGAIASIGGALTVNPTVKGQF